MDKLENQSICCEILDVVQVKVSMEQKYQHKTCMSDNLTELQVSQTQMRLYISTLVHECV